MTEKDLRVREERGKQFWNTALIALPIDEKEKKRAKKIIKKMKSIDGENVVKLAFKLDCTFRHQNKPEFEIGEGKRTFLLHSHESCVYKAEELPTDTDNGSSSSNTDSEGEHCPTTDSIIYMCASTLP